MRKISILLSLTLVLAASCSKQQIADSNESPIVFSAYSERAVTTKSLPTGLCFTPYDVTNGYYVQAWYKSSEYFQDKFKNDVAQSTGASKTYYWPTDIATNNVSFYVVGFSTGNGCSSSTKISADHKVIFTAKDDGMDDEMVVAKKENVASASTVSLTLTHALSKIASITFTPKSGDASATSDYTYNVTEIKFSHYKTATYNLKDSTWASLESSSSIKYDPSSFSGNSTTEVVGEHFTALIPQTVTISVTYDIRYGSSTGTTIFASTTKTGTLALEQGKSYAITIALSNDSSPIIFSADVSTWTADSKTVTVSSGS